MAVLFMTIELTGLAWQENVLCAAVDKRVRENGTQTRIDEWR